MEENYHLILLSLLGGTLCFFGCRESKQVNTNRSENQQVVYTYKAFPENEFFDYRIHSRIAGGKHYFYYVRTAANEPGVEDALFSGQSWFWRGDTLYQTFDHKRKNIPFLSKKLGKDTVRNDLGFITLANEYLFMEEYKIFQYQIFNYFLDMDTSTRGYSIDQTDYIGVSYMEKIGFLEINYINTKQDPQIIWSRKLIKINGVPLKKYLRRHNDFQMIIETD